MLSPRARRLRNGESRRRAPQRGGGEVARTTVDEVAVDIDVDDACHSEVVEVFSLNCSHIPSNFPGIYVYKLAC
jgi:hypothetical protein